MSKHLSAISLAALATLSACTFPFLTNVPAARGEAIGTSCADCPSYAGAFSVENNTGTTIKYQVRWGKRNAWKLITLHSGRRMKHSYPLGDNPQAKVPQPYVRFDSVGGDGSNVTPIIHAMEFYAVGYSGYGASLNRTEPKRYFFQYAADRQHLELYAQ